MRVFPCSLGGIITESGSLYNSRVNWVQDIDRDFKQLYDGVGFLFMYVFDGFFIAMDTSFNMFRKDIETLEEKWRVDCSKKFITNCGDFLYIDDDIAFFRFFKQHTYYQTAEINVNTGFIKTKTRTMPTPLDLSVVFDYDNIQKQYLTQFGWYAGDKLISKTPYPQSYIPVLYHNQQILWFDGFCREYYIGYVGDEFPKKIEMTLPTWIVDTNYNGCNNEYCVSHGFIWYVFEKSIIKIPWPSEILNYDTKPALEI